MSTHFHEQMDLYGELVLVNLINQKKNEGMLEQTFRDLVAKVALQGVNYEAFDFHKECSKMRYDRLSLLSEQLSNYKFGYFLKTRESGKILQKQVHNYLKITQNVIFEFWHFPSNVLFLKLTLFDRKLQVLKNLPNSTVFGIFNQL